mmetsp:Transcript_17646/g.59986  ORF Transcript_17646/g.59986 Transcript_17646/m.59986 type:complete len:313 (-) Transcript_17646:47-985(-)
MGKAATPVVVGVVLNVVSVVGIVIINKFIGSKDGYNFMVFISFLHFVFTTVGTRALLAAGVFEYKPVKLADVLPVAMGSLGSVAFMNLNLAKNSVGIYQLSKLACIPVTLTIEYVLSGKTVEQRVALTLIPLTLGVGIATVYDVEANVEGSVYAACAVMATSLAQIFTSSKQKGLGCNALQLLYHTSPIIAVGMLFMCPFFDDTTALYEYQYYSSVVVRIVVSCAFALLVNISNYMVLGRTSPLTYQVLGHFKTMMILLLGFLVFNKSIDSRQALGIIVAMVGVISYTEVKRRVPSSPEPRQQDDIESQNKK